MTPLVQFVTTLSSLGIVSIHIIIVFFLFLFVTGENNPIFAWIAKRAVQISLITAVLSAGGSYFYSHIAGFAPCELCWYQRIFLFSQIGLYAYAWLLTKQSKVVEKGIYICSLILSVFASIVGAFQYYGSMFNPAILAACEANGISCSKNYFVSFGYINIPLMALSAFLLLAFVAVIKIRQYR